VTMKWFTRLPEPPEYDYFWWLRNYPYERGVLDCSNKAAAYYFRLRALGIEAKVARVMLQKQHHALLWARVEGQEVYLDPTDGTWGWWIGQNKFQFTAFTEPDTSNPSYYVDGITYQEFLRS